MSQKKRLFIVGGGFGGVSVAQAMAKDKNFAVTLIDRKNYHLFQPLLYQVAMAGLNPADISTPFRSLFSGNKDISILMAEVDDLDLTNNKIHFDHKWHEYDYLVMGCGAKHSYFGHPEWEDLAPGLKTIEQATEIRRRILMSFELAEKAETDEQVQYYLNFVIIGGGPTGVELAGAIAEMVNKTLIKDFNRADLKKTKVILVEGGPRLLAGFPESQSEVTLKALTKMGVDVRLNARADKLTSNGLMIGSESVEANTIIWAAGVFPSQLTQKIPSDKDRAGRVIVGKDLSLPSFKNVFVIGDQAAAFDEKGAPLPGLAPVAMQQGNFIAKLLKEDVKGKPRPEFKYFDKGIMATIGRSKAVVSVGRLNLKGFPAWLMWVFIHVVFLMQFKNRIFVFLNWVWSYFSFGRGARLIVHKTWKFYSGEKIPIDKK